MKPILIKRYSTIKTCTQRAKQFATLTQKSGEPVENFFDRTQMAMIIVHEKARAAIPVKEVERLRGYNEKLMEQPIVAYPKREGRFMLRTDAILGEQDNVGGLGAVLLQQQKTAEAYASRPLKKHEKNYSAYLVEMAAAVWGIEHFDVYLIGKHFTLVTDHRPLEHLGTVYTNTLNRLQHLNLEYDFTIKCSGGLF
jgi:hypothetical protein